LIRRRKNGLSMIIRSIDSKNTDHSWYQVITGTFYQALVNRQVPSILPGRKIAALPRETSPGAPSFGIPTGIA
jgi:hypothetical protein